MTGILIFFLVIIVVTVIPVMIAVKLLDARNTGFIACTLAVIGSVAAENVSEVLISNPAYAGITAIVVTGLMYSFALDTTYKKAILIALLSFGVQYVAVLALAGVGISSGIVEVTS